GRVRPVFRVSAPFVSGAPITIKPRPRPIQPIKILEPYPARPSRSRISDRNENRDNMEAPPGESVTSLTVSASLWASDDPVLHVRSRGRGLGFQPLGVEGERHANPLDDWEIKPDIDLEV